MMKQPIPSCHRANGVEKHLELANYEAGIEVA